MFSGTDSILQNIFHIQFENTVMTLNNVKFPYRLLIFLL